MKQRKLISSYLSTEYLSSGILVVPVERIHLDSCAPQGVSIVDKVLSVRVYFGCLVQPRGSPEQLILIINHTVPQCQTPSKS
jgi:hypothetical protein